MAQYLLTSARLVVNAVPSAISFSFLLTSLIVTLNRDAGAGPGAILSVWTMMAAAYGLLLLAAFPLAVAAVRFFAARPLRVTWLHLKSIVWFMAAGTGLGLAAHAWNLAAGGDLLGAADASGLRRASVAMGLCWVAGIAAAASAQMKGSAAGRPRFRTALLLLACVLPASALGWGVGRAPGPAWPLSAGGPPAPRGALVVVALEGASSSEILPLVSEGRLPAFGDIMQSGSSGPLETLHPCISLPAWASLSTGRRPGGHGLRDAGLYRLAGMEAELRRVPRGVLFRSWLPSSWLSSRPPSPGDLKVRPQWEILDRMSVGAVFLDWPLAGPAAPPERGGAGETAAAWRSRLEEAADPALDPESLAGLLEAISGDARQAERVLRILEAPGGERPRFLAVRLGGLGRIGALPNAAGAEEEGDAVLRGGRPPGRLVSRYYELLDGFLGSLLQRLGPQDYLVVLSPYGREAVSGPLRTLRGLAGLPDPGASHASGPAGVFMISGPGISPGRQVEDLRVIDVLPISLYLLGLPVGRDMDGRLPRRLFERRFLETNPITFVSSYG